MRISACELISNECSFFSKECQSCFTMKGKPFWTYETTATGTCSLYDCSMNQKKFRNCGACDDLPCKMFVNLKDPNITELEYQQSIQNRINNLRGS